MLNQLESLTEHVGGSNKLVDRWLHVRKHLLVAYYNLVGIKPGKESYMRLNEKALDDFVRARSITSPPDTSVFMNVFSINWKGTGSFKSHKIWPLLEANTQLIMDYYDSSPKLRLIMITSLSFKRFYRISAKRWKPGSCSKIS